MANKKIEVFLHGCNLGTLTYNEKSKTYTYNSNIKEEEKFKLKHRPELFSYNLWGSKNAVYYDMPELFKKEVNQIVSRQDIMRDIKADENMHPFEILVRWGKVSQCEEFLVLKTKSVRKVEKLND